MARQTHTYVHCITVYCRNCAPWLLNVEPFTRCSSKFLQLQRCRNTQPERLPQDAILTGNRSRAGVITPLPHRPPLCPCRGGWAGKLSYLFIVLKRPSPSWGAPREQETGSHPNNPPNAPSPTSRRHGAAAASPALRRSSDLGFHCPCLGPASGGSQLPQPRPQTPARTPRLCPRRRASLADSRQAS